MYHRHGRTVEKPIISLYNPILLRVVCDCQLLLDPYLLEKILEFIGGVLSPII
jgi:hypothetical protein